MLHAEDAHRERRDAGDRAVRPAPSGELHVAGLPPSDRLDDGEAVRYVVWARERDDGDEALRWRVPLRDEPDGGG